MKKFEIFRYLKSFRYLVLIIALVGSVMVYSYASSKQQYAAKAVIEYTNEQAVDGKTPSGTLIDPTEIFSAAVITDVIEELGLNTTVDNIRSKCRVKAIIPEEEEVRKTAALEENEEYEYYPTKYIVTFTADSDYSLDYVLDVLDTMLNKYFAYYSAQYVDSALVPNNVANISVGKYDFLDCVEILDNSVTEIQDYLNIKSGLYPNFRANCTGYSFQDLLGHYNYLSDNTIPQYYATILEKKLTIDGDALVNRHINRIVNYDIRMESLSGYTIREKDVTNQYGDKVTLNGSNIAGSPGYESDTIITQVEDRIGGRINTETTYDALIRDYVSAQSKYTRLLADKAFSQKVVSVFQGVGQTNGISSEVAVDLTDSIESTVLDMGTLYGLLTQTIYEFNQYTGAQTIGSLTSTSGYVAMNVNLYTMIASVLFLFVGCAGAIVLGRMGDFVSAYLYTDRKAGIANRAKCDLVIEEYSASLVKENFTCITFMINFLDNAARNIGDLQLRQFATVLDRVSQQYGFVGYNGGKQFIALFESCSLNRAMEFISVLTAELENAQTGENPIVFSYGIAESTSDVLYNVRDLIRLSIKRQAQSTQVTKEASK